MRQEKREIKEFREIIEVMNRCDVCRLALYEFYNTLEKMSEVAWN